MPQPVNISEVIDKSRLSAFQIGIFILCGICLMLDGFDVQAIGYVAPVIRREYAISDPVLSHILAAALVGVLVRLSAQHEQELIGKWFFEHGFGPLDIREHPLFDTIEDAEGWIGAHVCQRRT